MTADEYRRACIGCAGAGWLQWADDNGALWVKPCPECRPATAKLNQRGAYAPDAPVDHPDRDRLKADHDGHQPRTALYPVEPISAPPER